MALTFTDVSQTLASDVTGGCVLADGTFVVCGSGFIARKTPAGSWFDVGSTGDWRAMARSGSRIVAVGSTVGGFNVVWSDDVFANFYGANCPVDLLNIIHDGSVFVACDDSAIYTSPDGQTWTQRLSPGGTSLTASALNFSGSQSMILAYDGSGYWTSPPGGTTWTWHAVADGWHGAVVWDGTTYVAVQPYSSDAYRLVGNAWVAEAMPASKYYKRLIRAGNTLVALSGVNADNTVMVKEGAAAWASAALPHSAIYGAALVFGNTVTLISRLYRASAAVPVVANTGQAEVGITIDVYGVGFAETTLQIDVLDGGVVNGSDPVTASMAAAAVFGALVEIDGVERRDDVEGVITIEAEEGAARIAEFSLYLDAGTIDLATWVGRSVVISIADFRTGSQVNALRLFTGVIDLPTFNVHNSTVALRCTDDFQNVIDQMTASQIESLVGGVWSPVVFDKTASGWRLYNDRVSTANGLADLSPYGQPRFTAYTAKAFEDMHFVDDSGFDASVSVSIADRSRLVNRIEIDFGYRTPKSRSAGYNVSYDIFQAFNTGFGSWVQNGGAFIVRTQIIAAIENAGGSVESITYTALPTIPQILPNGAIWSPNQATDPLLCTGFAAVVSFAFAQYWDEQHAITVEAPESIAAVGVLRSTMSGALEGKTVDLSAIETSTTLYQNDITAIPPITTASVVPGHINSASIALTTETNRDAANLAMSCLIATAQTKIAEAHRLNSVTFSVPLNAALDVDKTVLLTAQGVQAKGKVRRVQHVIDTAAGTATSDVELAISAVAGLGITHPSDTANTTTTDDNGTPVALGDPVVTFDGEYLQTQTLSITFPGIEAHERELAVINIPRTVNAGLPEDLFTLTMSG